MRLSIEETLYILHDRISLLELEKRELSKQIRELQDFVSFIIMFMIILLIIVLTFGYIIIQA